MTREYGSYRYFAQECGTFRELCKDPEIPEDKLEIAFQALFYLACHTEEAPPSSDTNIDQLLMVAMMLYERSTYNRILAAIEGVTHDPT